MAFDLRARRMELGLSQRQLADLIGCPRDAIRRVEDGTGSAHPSTLLKIANHFDVPVTALIPSLEDEAVA